MVGGAGCLTGACGMGRVGEGVGGCKFCASLVGRGGGYMLGGLDGVSERGEWREVNLWG